MAAWLVGIVFRSLDASAVSGLTAADIVLNKAVSSSDGAMPR